MGAATLAASTASAATLDFVAEAAGNERGVADGTVINMDGINVTFSSNYFAYFDDLSGGKPAGLGVCKVLTGGAQCNPGSDDNVSQGEAVTLGFADGAVNFSGLSFFNSDHNPVNGDNTLLIGVNGAALVEYTFLSAISSVFSGIDSITFAFGGQSANDLFYVGGATAVSAVPLPAGLPLYGAGLAVLGYVGWRRKRKATATT